MTRQSSDKLVYKGYEYEIRDQISLEEYIHKEFIVPPMEIYFTACHRRYNATFEIKNNFLYLKVINGERVDKPVNYTGLLNLYDGYNIVDEKNMDQIKFIFNNKLVFRLWCEKGLIKREEKVTDS